MTTSPHARDLPKSPATIFIELWRKASELPPNQRTTAETPGLDFINKVKAMLACSSGIQAHDHLTALLANIAGTRQEKNGMMIAVMRTIDDVFYNIHPRASVLPVSLAKRPAIPNWLKHHREDRLVTGHYAETDGYRLVPRGPLLRHARAEFASSADCLADRFAALTVVPTTLLECDRSITIRHKVIGVDAARGVVPSKSRGAERVAFLPIAEVAADLKITVRTISGKNFVDFRIDSTVDPVDRLISALCKVGYADIVMAPELVMAEKNADQLTDACLTIVANVPRIIIAGSGQTEAQDVDQPWNEARILNGSGTELWRQRKIWPAGITQARAKEYGLSTSGDDLVMEDTASGAEIAIVDADGLGRCIVLVCQDLESHPLAAELIRHFQPDWIFTPILDTGADIGRWAHRKALALSSASSGRFLVACSTSLAEMVMQSRPPICGLAVGPMAADAEDEGRCVEALTVEKGSSPGYATVTWRSGKWTKSTVGSD